jgi:hypothetical protein
MSADSSMKYKTSSMQYPFWFGRSAARMAACVTHPFDLGMFAPVTRRDEAWLTNMILTSSNQGTYMNNTDP